MARKITAGAATVLGLLAAWGAASGQPAPELRSADPALLERGRYLVLRSRISDSIRRPGLGSRE